MCTHWTTTPTSFTLPVLISLCVYSSAWLTGYDDPMIDTINERIEALTGLEIDTAEELQVIHAFIS